MTKRKNVPSKKVGGITYLKVDGIWAASDYQDGKHMLNPNIKKGKCRLF